MNMAELSNLSNLSIVNAALRGSLRANEPMSGHVSWRVGGKAARAYVPADAEDLLVFLRLLPADEPVLFAGLGSNLLVRDGGFRGTVVLMHTSHGEIRMEDGLLYAQAGVASPKVARFAATHGFEGAEFLAGVPGTVTRAARRYLQQLEESQLNSGGQNDLFAAPASPVEAEPKSDALHDAMQQVNPDDLSPREALDLIYRLKHLT